MTGSSPEMFASGRGVIGEISASWGGMEPSSGTGSSVDTAHMALAGGCDSSPLDPHTPQALPATHTPSALALTLVSPFYVPAHLPQTPLPASNPD